MAVADRRKREREQRRNQLVDAAEKLFFAKDYDNVTMDEIANEAEVNKALLYYYFKNKETLFFAVNLRIAQMLHELYIKYSKLDISGLNKIKEIGIILYNFSEEYPDHFRLYNYAKSERFSSADNEYAKKAIELSIKREQVVIDAFMQGVEEGVIRNDLDPVEMSVYLTIIAKIAMNIDPELKIMLDSKGINQDRFWKDLYRFIQPALTKPFSADLERVNTTSNGKK